jgi:hypothetical protein
LWVVVEDRPVQLLQVLSGVDSQVVLQPCAYVVVSGQRVGLPARLVEGAHERGVQPLLVGVLADQLSQLGDELYGPAERQLDLQALLQRPDSFLVEDLGGVSDAFVVDARQRNALPQGQRAAVVFPRRGKVAAAGGGPCLCPPLTPLVQVQLGRGEGDPVAVGVGDYGWSWRSRLDQLPAQPRDASLHLAAGVAGPVVIGPDRFGQRLDGYRVARVEQEHGEHDTLPFRGDGDVPGSDVHLHRAEYPDAQDLTFNGPASARGDQAQFPGKSNPSIRPLS